MNRYIRIPSFRKLFLGIMTLVAGIFGSIEAHAQFGGVPLWTNRYDGTANKDDSGRAVAVDGNGNVLVTGYSEGNGTSRDYATIKYSRGGIPLWTNRYNGPGNTNDETYAMAVDASGNVFVTGYSVGNGTSRDYATIKYSSAGVSLWTNRYNGTANGIDEASTVALDASGNVFVTGYSAGNGSSDDYATIKYSNAGMPLWTNRYNGPGNGGDTAYAVAVDASSNVLVTGFSAGSGSSFDYATIKYSNAGIPLWTNRYNRANNADFAVALAVDNSGRAVVAGYSQGTNFSWDYSTIVYSSAGMPLWTNLYDGPDQLEDYCNSLAVDGSGTVFVTGTSFENGYPHYATIAYSNVGIPLWTNRYNGPANTFDHAYVVKVDSSGNVFVTGDSYGIGSADDYTTIKYSNAGVPVWTNRYSGFGSNRTDIAVAMALDSSGNVFVTGTSASTNAYSDFATIAYSGANAPSLTITRTPTNTITISWPSFWTGFTLQQNTNDISTSNWSNVVDAPTDDGTNKLIILTHQLKTDSIELRALDDAVS